MSHQSMARVSSSSMESDYVPAMVPFNWETAPGTPADDRVVEVWSPLPLPPGRRPKDGFYLPFSRLVQSSESQNEVQNNKSADAISPQKKKFNLKFHGISKKQFSTGRKSSKIREGVGDEDNHAGSVLDILSGHRIRSMIRRETFVESHKKRSLFGQCFRKTSKAGCEEGKKYSSSLNLQHRSTRLSSGPSMASMLIALCPDECDKAEVDAENETADERTDDISVSHSPAPKARLSSPEENFKGQEDYEYFELHHCIAMDPASQATTSHEKITFPEEMLANEDMTMPSWIDYRINTSGSLLKELDIARPTEECRCGRLLQPRRLGFKNTRETFEGQGTARSSLARDFSKGSNCSKSSNLEYSYMTSSSSDEPEAFARCRTPTSCGKTTEHSLLQRHDNLEERLKMNQHPTSVSTSKQPLLLQKEAMQTTTIKPRSSTSWREALKASSLWQPATFHGAGNSDTNESDEGSECSTSSWEYESSRENLETMSIKSPVLCNFPSPKPATWHVSEKLLKSSFLLQYKHQREQSTLESPRSSFMVDPETTLPDHSKGSVELATCNLSNSSMESKMAQQEANAGVGSSGKSLPIYLRRRNMGPRSTIREGVAKKM